MLYNNIQKLKHMELKEIVPVRLSKRDKQMLTEKAIENRLKLSTYLRHELTKNL